MPPGGIVALKKSTKRKWKKGLAVRAAALTCFFTILLIYGVGVYFFQDFIFLGGDRSPVTLSAVFLPANPADIPHLISQPHLENAEVSSEPARAQADYVGYVTLPASLALDEKTVIAFLKEQGITAEVIYSRSPRPTGDLLQLYYAGFSDEIGYHINPLAPVQLIVSGDKPEMPAYTGKNMVYITFDDGPSAYTEQILDVLGLAGVSATFFTLGTSVEKYPETAVRIVQEGHLLASHGTTHEYDLIYQSPEALYADVQKWEQIVSSLGILPDKLCFRFPGGSVNPYTTAAVRNTMIEGLHWRGYHIFDWNIVTGDSLLRLQPDEVDPMEYLEENFLESWETSNEYDVKILLLHDNVPQTVRHLGRIIDYIKKQGYMFGTLDMLGTEFYTK